MSTKEIEIGATLCDCCDYESEFNLINEEDIVCDDLEVNERD
jgi:hypothetical protein